MADTIQLEIVTPEKMIVREQVSEVQVPGKGGYLGILPGHAPLITELAVGEITYRTMDGKTRALAVAWGFAEVLPNKVTLLAEVAERAEDIDVERARRARERAEAALKSPAPDVDHQQLEADLQRANTRISVAAKIDPQLANLLP